MKQKTKVIYAYLDAASRKHLEQLAKRFGCSMSKAMNQLIIAHKSSTPAIFTKGTRGSK